MRLIDKVKEIISRKNSGRIVIAAGVLGLCLIMISTFTAKPSRKEEKEPDTQSSATKEVDFCKDAEERVSAFLRNIEGVGDVQVLVTVNSSEEYVYATEGKKTSSGDKKEEDRKYVMVGNGANKTGLLETVRVPEISGIVIACSGGDSAAVQERIYKAVGAAFSVPVGRIYVTKLK